MVRFRNYHCRDATALNPAIWEAARATSAAASFFDPITIGPYGQEFIDAATGANNPVDLVLEEARTIWPNDMHRIQYIISVGTGEPSLKAFGDDILSIGKTLLQVSTDANTTASRFPASHPEFASGTDRTLHIYQRFNVRKGLENIKLQDADKMGEIASATQKYLEDGEQKDRMRVFGLKVREFVPNVCLTLNFFDRRHKGPGKSEEVLVDADMTITDLFEKWFMGKCKQLLLFLSSHRESLT